MPDGTSFQLASSIVSGFAAVVASVGAFVAVKNYRMNADQIAKTQEAKRKDQAYYQMSRVLDSPGSRNAAGMLTFPDWEVPLPSADRPRRWQRVTQDEAAGALLPGSIVPLTPNEVRTAIQDCFHDFIQRFAILEELIQKDMFDYKDCSDLIYRWSSTLAVNGHDPMYATSALRLARSFRVYAYENSYDPMQKLFERYGKDVRPTASDWESLRRETQMAGSAVRVDWAAADALRRKV